MTGVARHLTGPNVVRFPSDRVRVPVRRGHEGRAGGASPFLVLHLILTSMGAVIGGVLAAACALIAGGSFWDGVILYLIGAGLGFVVSMVAVRLGRGAAARRREGLK